MGAIGTEAPVKGVQRGAGIATDGTLEHRGP